MPVANLEWVPPFFTGKKIHKNIIVLGMKLGPRGHNIQRWFTDLLPRVCALFYFLPTEITQTFTQWLHNACNYWLLNMLKCWLVYKRRSIPEENKNERNFYRNGTRKKINFHPDCLRSPCGKRQLQLEPWRPRWSTPTHTSTSPSRGPSGAAVLGSPPACLETLSKPRKSRREYRFSSIKLK